MVRLLDQLDEEPVVPFRMHERNHVPAATDARRLVDQRHALLFQLGQSTFEVVDLVRDMRAELEPIPAVLRADVEAIRRRSAVKFELRGAGAKDLVYEVSLPISVRTDRIANAILTLQPNGETEVAWEEKKKK